MRKNIFSKPKTKEEKKEKSKELLNLGESTELDEQFVQNFIDNGGHFLMCSDWDNAVMFLQNILIENQWKNISCHQKQLLTTISPLNLNIVNYHSSEVHFSYCESMIAKNGNIMFSSNQTNGICLSDLPRNFVVFAHPDQIVCQLSDGLQMINRKKTPQLPSNITSITAKSNQLEFSTNTDLTKNIYLLLIEYFHG